MTPPTPEIDPALLEEAELRFFPAREEPDELVRARFRAVVELIAARAVEAALARAAADLTAWADENPDPDWSSARAARRRTLHAAARRITPKMTDAEAAQAFMDLLKGRAPGFVCVLDAAGRPIPPDADGGEKHA